MQTRWKQHSSILVFAGLMALITLHLIRDKAPIAHSPLEITNVSSINQTPQTSEIQRSVPTPATQPALNVAVAPEQPMHVTPDGTRLSLDNKFEMQLCGFESAQTAKTLDDFLRNIQREFGPAVEQSLDWRNVHFQTADGESRRLRIWQQNSQMKAQLYLVDEEGLPIPIQGDSEAFSRPTIANIEAYLKPYQVQEAQESLTMVFGKPGNAIVNFETRNGLVRELSTRNGTTTFQCVTAPDSDSADCKCLRRTATE